MNFDCISHTYLFSYYPVWKLILNDCKLNLDPPNASSDSVVLQDSFSGDPNEIVIVTTNIIELINSPCNCNGFQDPTN